MAIDWNKPVQTVCGKPVRILCTDAPGPYPVVGYVHEADDVCTQSWTLDGKAYLDDVHNHDLEQVPPPKVKLYFYVDANDMVVGQAGACGGAIAFESQTAAKDLAGVRPLIELTTQDGVPVAVRLIPNT